MYGWNFTKGYQGRGFQPLSSTEAYVLGTNGNLWHEGGPWGQVPPPRNQVDGNVAAFQALGPAEAYVLGTNGTLWHETGPWGTVPPARQQVDGNVVAFQVLGSRRGVRAGHQRHPVARDGPVGDRAAGPAAGRRERGGLPGARSRRGVRAGHQRHPVARDGPVGDRAAGPAAGRRERGGLPGARSRRGVRAGRQRHLVARDRPVGDRAAGPAAGRRERGGLPGARSRRGVRTGHQRHLVARDRPVEDMPPARQQVDGNVLSFYALSGNEAFVLGTNSTLCAETGPWGTVPPGAAAGRRQRVAGQQHHHPLLPERQRPRRYRNPYRLRVRRLLLLGGWSPSNILTGTAAQDVNLVFTLRDSRGTLWVFSTAGTVPIEGRYNFNDTGTNVLLAQNWKFLSAGYTWHDNYSATIDLPATGEEALNWYNQNKQTINQIVQVVGSNPGPSCSLVDHGGSRSQIRNLDRFRIWRQLFHTGFGWGPQRGATGAIACNYPLESYQR